jgi:hypothetical protein
VADHCCPTVILLLSLSLLLLSLSLLLLSLLLLLLLQDDPPGDPGWPLPGPCWCDRVPLPVQHTHVLGELGGTNTGGYMAQSRLSGANGAVNRFNL